jgi:Domain of unknown function (DUF4276)
VKKLVFLLEEQSMQEALKGVLPGLVPKHVSWQCVPHEGKQDLDRSIPRKLRGWREPGVHFVVVRDQDSADCQTLKARLRRLCADGHRPDTLIRIACRELESWFLGDLAAVEVGTGVKNLSRLQDRRKFHDPDSPGSPASVLKEIAPGYQKVSGARRIGPYMDLERNRSHSFRVFVKGIRGLVGAREGDAPVARPHGN